MLKPASMTLGIGLIVAAGPTSAQTYDPSYPVCLQVYGIEGGYIACGYTSMAQCAASASGRAAQCLVNPYWPSARPALRTTPRGARHKLPLAE